MQPNMGIFKPALDEMNKAGLWYRNPEPFSSYLKKYNLPQKDTASSISVDSLCRLDSELRQAGVMVFRMGVAPGQKHTRFALAKAEQPDMSDYFLVDQTLFANTQPELFISSASQQALFGFSLLPQFTETSLVNLALFSGLLGHALRLDNSTSQSAPATGQSTFTFNFRPRSNESEPVWQHINGQIEIDAVFSGYRQGKPVAIIVESKASDKMDSLAKHKLLYPYLSLRSSLPRYMQVLLVYMRAIRSKNGYDFYIAECSIHESQDIVPSITDLTPTTISHLVLKI